MASTGDHDGYYDWRIHFPFLGEFATHYPEILAELNELRRRDWWAWPETSLYRPEEGDDWKVFPICYTFPASDPDKTVWLDHAHTLAPKTTALLSSLPGIRTALFSRLGPGTSLVSHTGWADLANHVLRCHLPLVVPDGAVGPTCGMIVNDVIQHHRPGEVLVFDDSLIHSAFNNHPTENRYILIFDLARPGDVPSGTASGGTTEELHSFMDYFK